MLKTLNKLFYFTTYTFITLSVVGLGLYMAILKNKHTTVQRDIHKIEKRTQNHENLFTQYSADLQNSSNRFLLKEKIKTLETGLVPIDQSDILFIPAVSGPHLVQTK